MAASSDFSGKQLLTDIDDKVLLCAICMERFKSPKILPCYHTFCEPCLTEWVKTNNGELICPTCKKLCPLPSEGVRALDRNRFIDDLLGVVGDVRPDRSDMAVCELCEKEAKHWCGDCGGHFFCSTCIQNHSKLTVLKAHTPMKIEEYIEKMSTKHFRIIQPRFCDTHSGNKLEFFCDTCQVPTCYKCTVVEHAITGHTMISLESALEKYMPTMKAHSEKVAQKISNLKLRMNRVNDVRKDLDANRSTADLQIKTLCQKLIDAITNLEIKLHSEVDDIYMAKVKQIDAETELLEQRIASAESIHSYLNHLLTFGGAVDIMTAKQQMKNQQQHYDVLANVPYGDIDSDLVFKENPGCLKIHLGVVKGPSSSASRAVNEGKEADVTDGNISTETATLTERKGDGTKLEKQDGVENKARDKQAFEEREYSDWAKLRKVGEDHNDPEETSADKDVDQIGETRCKDDSTMPSDSRREKPYDVESVIGSTTTENSGAHIGDEGLQLTNAQNGKDQGTSRSRAEDELGLICIKVGHAESEQADERTEVRSKTDDEEQEAKTENKNKLEQPYGNDIAKVKYCSQATDWTDHTRGVGSENDKTYHRNKTYDENVDPCKQQYSGDRDSSYHDTHVTATASNIQQRDLHIQDQQSDASSTTRTDSYGTTKDASPSGTPYYKRWWRDFKISMYSRKANLLFYKNEIKSEPQGDYIDNIHKHWWGNYDKLERHHGYIQWIFPVGEKGMNYDTQELQHDEAEKIKSDKKALSRVLKSYEMMLDFYGMELVDKRKGTIERAVNWIDRYNHLNRSKHNYLRITRMLKSLGELGYEHLKTPFVEFVLKEVLEHGELRNSLNSCVQYWLHTIKSSTDRKRLTKYFDSHYEFR